MQLHFTACNKGSREGMCGRNMNLILEVIIL